MPQSIYDSGWWDFQLDVTEYLAGKGIPLEPGEEAIYQLASRVLVVRARPSTVGKVNGLHFLGCAGNAPTLLRLRADLVEFSATKSELDADLTYETLRKEAGDSWQLLSRVVAMGKPNERTLAQSKSGLPETKSHTRRLPKGAIDPLPSGQFGTTFEFEPVLQPDGRTALVNMAVIIFRAAKPGSMEWETALSAPVNLGSSTVVQLSSAPVAADQSQPAKLRALILKVDAIYADKTNPALGKRPTTPVVLPQP